MTRKDSEKDAERPHYYSQFWLDVAAGRRVIGTPKTEEGADQAEAETPVPEPTPLRKAGRTSTAAVADGYKETRLQSVAEPAFEPEEEDYVEPEQEEVALADTVEDLELPTLDVDETFEDADISDLGLNPEEEESEDEDYFDDEEEEEEEEEDEWAARGRKKPKPGRPVKQPKVKKPKRDRRGF
jgi:hypothetical protein